MAMQDLIEISEITKQDVDEIFALGAELKSRLKRGIAHRMIEGKTLAMIFEKPSLRTRVGFEAGMEQLGGHAIYLSTQEINLGVRESVEDGARVLERYVDGILARTFSHERVIDLARFASVPVINGLTDKAHPCQVLSDCYTILEKLGSLEGATVAYIGDGNNVANSLINAAAVCGFTLRLGCPKGYEPDKDILGAAKQKAPDSIVLTEDPVKAVSGAQVIYTDTWTSMGQEAESETRRGVFRSFQVNSALIKHADPNVLVMHCLPAHRGEEITDEVIDGKHSIVYDQAENRLHVQKAIMVLLMGKN